MPVHFEELQKKFPTPATLESSIKEFCESYHIDVGRCSEELYSFASVYKHLSGVTFPSDPEFPVSLDEDDIDTDGVASQITGAYDALRVLSLLCNPNFHLQYGYPTIAQAYAVRMEILCT